MRVYITTQGASIVKQGDRLLVKKDDTIFHTLFLHKLEQLIIFGNISISAPARRSLFKEKIDTVFLSKDGRYIGRYMMEEPKNFFLRKKQFDLLNNKDFSLNMSKWIVKAKFLNMSNILMRIARTKDKKNCKDVAYEIKSLLNKIDQANNLDSVRGYEGKGTALYFSCFGEGFNEDWGFRKRVRRPPTDPVNSVLSLLYTFLFNRVYSAIRAANLDPFVGNLHMPDYGRYALVMDLMEEFRVIVVDTLCLSLFNLRILKKEHFVQISPEEDTQTSEESDDVEMEKVVNDKFGLMSKSGSSEFFDVPPQRFVEDGVDTNREDKGKLPVQLTKDALKKVIQAFEKKLQTEFYYEPLDKVITYEKAIFEQARQYRKVIEEEIKTYVPLVLK